MKGLILYSSKTGNTKIMAEQIYKKLKEKFQIYLCDISSIDNSGAVPCNLGTDPLGVPLDMEKSSKEKIENFDFVLLGAWIDRGTLNKNAMKVFKRIKNKKIGLFATLGAMPNSDHGKKVKCTLEKLLKNKESLGTYLCPGQVDPKMIKKLEGLTGMVVPKKIKDKMIQTSLKSRKATEEELKDAGEFFYKKINSITT